ncbi:hypothetical protein BZG05_12945 [Salinivibrio kushneri]|uniref:hypothetical protein n=1 Tax=Salinivibrio kushneri TaxID=1908198 RepID=UPI0009D2B96D|nr:hypothetical protein [Salinivibrio kushneri]OOE32865.1 hypothetical protein BZG05_12945 [Salinivibrio kushneri]
MQLFAEILNHADDVQAMAYAAGVVWSEIETTETDKFRHWRHVGETNGVAVWHCGVTDTYLFEDVGE